MASDELDDCPGNYYIDMGGTISGAEELLVNDDATSQSATGPMI